MTGPIRGIFPALLTAYDAEGELDSQLLRALISRLLTQGAQGFFICGTSAEFTVLSVDERETVAEIALSEVTGQVPVAVHVGAPRVEDAIRLAQHAARRGADAISSVPPYYYPTRSTTVIEYLREIATATTLPFYYYHIPSCTGQPLDVALLDELLKLPNFVGLKFSDPNFVLFQQLKRHAASRAQFICGADCMLLSSLMLGGEGAVGSTYNFLLPLFVKEWKAYTRGELDTAQSVQAQANKLILLLDDYPHIAAVKEALRILDLSIGEPRPPLSRMDPSEKEELAEQLMKNGLWDIAGITPLLRNVS